MGKSKIARVSVITLLATTTFIGTALASPYIYRYRGTEIIKVDPTQTIPPIDDGGTDGPGDDQTGAPGGDGTDDDAPTEVVCGSGSDSGELGCSDYTSDEDRGTLTPPTMVKPPAADEGTGDDDSAEPGGIVGSVQRCFTFSGGYGNYTVASISWGDSDWLDYQEIVPQDRPALPWERPGYNMTASYPSNSAFPRKVTDGERYCVVYHLNGTVPEDYDGWSFGTSVSVSDYAPEDMRGDRADIMANRSNGLDFGLSISRADVMKALGL